MRRRQEPANFGLRRVQRLEGHVGYLHLASFGFADLGAGEVAVAAMRLMHRTDALIVDLRGNGGGDGQTAAMYLGWLLPRQEAVEEHVYRSRPSQRIITPSWLPAGRYGADKEVYVLIDAETISAGEMFAYNVQVYRRGTLVGERTVGAANATVTLPADEHFLAAVPMGQSIHPVTKTSWEGVGVTPDVAVKGSDAFHTAYRAALTKLATRSEDADRAEEARGALATLGAPVRP